MSASADLHDVWNTHLPLGISCNHCLHRALNYWRDRDAKRAAAPPPPPWPAVDPGLLEEGRPKLPAFPLKVFPRQWREWVSDAAHWAGSSEDYIAQALLASVAGLCGQGVSARITEAWSEPVIL